MSHFSLKNSFWGCQYVKQEVFFVYQIKCFLLKWIRGKIYRIILLQFDSNNEGIANVRNFIKPDMTAAFDYNDDNSHFAWTSFAIEYAEIWDGSTIPTYTKDSLDNCVPFTGFDNEDFIC